MKRIVIHSGPGKTGTSAIQYWFNENKLSLAERGIFYPDHAVDANNVSSGNLRKIFTENENGKFSIDKSGVSRIIDEFYDSEYFVLFFSSEFFFYRIKEINRFIPDAEFVFYLRNPLELFESGYNQGVKRHKKTNVCDIPKNFDFDILDYMKEVYSLLGSNRCHVRAYGKSFFINGNIVSDVLHLLGGDPGIAQEFFVNRGYTYDALEFKRNANFFPIETIQPELDRILQKCGIGENKYSLLKKEKYEFLKRRLVNKLQDFVNDTGLHHLNCFVDYINSLEQLPVKRQGRDNVKLDEVGEYVKNESPDMYFFLKDIVSKHPDLILPNPEFYSFFCIEYEGIKPVIDLENLVLLTKKLRKQPNMQEADVCREIGLFFEMQKNNEAARYFMEAASIFRPGAPFIQSKVNEYRIKSAVQERSNHSTKKSIQERLLRVFSGNGAK